MRKNYLMKSISIILMLLAMMFSCQPVSEDIDSGNSNSNNTNQGGNNDGDNTGGGNENTGGNTEKPQALTLQQIINNTNAGEEIDLSKYKDVTDYSATVNKTLTIKNGSLSNAKLIVTAENVKLEKLEKVSVSTSSRLTINNSKLSDLLIGANSEMSRSGTLSTEMSLAMASITGCEIENVELIGFNSQLNITDVKTKINDIVTSTKAKIILEAGSYEGMKDPTVTDDGELTRIDMTKEKELSVLSIYSNPKKAEYQIGEELDVTGLVVMGTYTASIEVFKSGGWKGEAVDSVTKWEDEKDYTVTCGDFSTAGVKIVTITSNIDTKVKCNFYVYVKDAQNTEIKEPEITDITPKSLGTPKTLYRVGEKLDLSWIQVVGTYNDLEINLAYTSEPANGTTLTTVGETTVTLYYNDEKIAEFPIIVENSFTVKFYDGIDNSKPLYTQKVTAGDGLKLPSSPEREDCIFVGWYYGETKIEAGYVITGDLNLTAKWDKLTTIEVATDEVASTIANLSAGIYKLVAMGEMIPDMLTSIAESMKNNASAEITLDLSGTTGLTEIPQGTFASCMNLTGIVIPNSVTKICWVSFGMCGLTSVVIPDSVTTIEVGVFQNCTSLTNVTIGKGVTEIRDGAFSFTSAIFEVAEENEKFSTSEDGKILYNKDKTVLLAYPTATGDITIPNGVTSIGNAAFAACHRLTNVTIPDSVTSIGNSAFSGCVSMASIVIPNKVTEIKNATFQDCRKLTTITIPDSVTTIGDGVFRECTALIDVTIPKNVTKIGDYAFAACESLERITFADTTTWYYTGNEDYTGGKKIDVTNPRQNATYLAEDYYHEYWYKTDGGSTLTADIMGKGIYTYTLNIDEISGDWGGTPESPTFSMLLLTDEQARMGSFFGISEENPGYQFYTYGNMKIADTSVAGNYSVYGDSTINEETQNYSGISATVSDSTITVTVDLSKIVKTQLKPFWSEKFDAEAITENEYIDFSDYKPYVIALGQDDFDAVNFVMNEWNADIMKMTLKSTSSTEDVLGTGIYSYKLNIKDIFDKWGGSTGSPTFSVVLLTDEQLEACKEAQDFYQATVAKPEYQISWYDHMKIADTSQTGDYVVYGKTPVDDEYQYYDGVAATVTDTIFELFIDMSKIDKTQLWARYNDFASPTQRHITESDFVDLTDYKPYVIALGQEQFDSDNYVFTAWSADVMKMTLVTSFPTDPVKAAPKVLTYYDLKYIAGNATMDETTGWKHVLMDDNSYTFVSLGGDAFKFTSGTWDFQIGGAQITALNTEFELYDGNTYGNITFSDGVLTPGNEYTISLIVRGDNVAYVKVTEVLPEGIGYIAYSDGTISAEYDSAKTAVGVVIEVTDGVATKIVSLTETTAEWSIEEVDTNATSEIDGMANLRAIQSIDGWENKYPAFKWCDDYTDASDNSNWYLPAKDELNQLYNVRYYVNAAIGKITAGGGNATVLDISDNGYYWSSSEYDNQRARWQRFSDGYQNYYGYKSDTNFERAIRAF